MHTHKTTNHDPCTLCLIKNIFSDEYFCHWKILSESSIPKENPRLEPLVFLNLNKAKPSGDFEEKLEKIAEFSIKTELEKLDEKVRLVYSELYEYASLYEEVSEKHEYNLVEELCGFKFGPFELELGQDIQTRIRQMVVLSQVIHITSKCVFKEAIKRLGETILNDRCALRAIS